MHSVIAFGRVVIQSLYARLLDVDRHSVLLLRLRTTALVIALGVGTVFALDTIRQWFVLGQHPLSLDFALYRASAIQGMQFGWNHLYDVRAQRSVYDAQQAAYQSLGPMLWAPNVYTPPVSWLGLPFTYLPLTTGYLIWSVLVFAATAFAYVTLAPGALLAKLAQTALAFGPYLVLLSLSEGQVTSFQIAGIAACWWLLKRGRDGWAGLALVALVLKPQTMTLVPLTMLAAARYRTFLVWLIATATLGVTVLVNIGFDGSIAYLQRLQYASANPGEYLLGPWYNLTMHFASRVGRYGADVLALSLVLWVAWRHRRAGPEIPIAAGLIGSLLVASYLHLNDLLTLFPAAWLILRRYPRWWMGSLMAGGYVVALMCTDSGTAHWGEGLLLFETAALMVLAVTVVPSSSVRRAAPDQDSADRSMADKVALAGAGSR